MREELLKSFHQGMKRQEVLCPASKNALTVILPTYFYNLNIMPTLRAGKR